MTMFSRYEMAKNPSFLYPLVPQSDYLLFTAMKDPGAVATFIAIGVSLTMMFVCGIFSANIFTDIDEFHDKSFAELERLKVNL